MNMRQSTNSSQEQNEKAMSANSMFLIALLSYTLINQLGITKSNPCKYCLRLYDGTYENGSYTDVYKSVGSLSPPWIPGSVCVPLIHDSKRQPHTGVYMKTSTTLVRTLPLDMVPALMTSRNPD
ncbi:hypothetical protein MS3_00001467 [Schistosoma haematobium]|uniref:Interleukin-4 inducing immunoglobulin-binding domain-containing protein n=1 Tax=Schistosoma haematobium TaxID=6185 RepID=A0A922S4H6_SCHHA|nr:hypothetical protein MS3_00001467 [Schistosoma haematobium]KAH9593761.1 hypothetical protein MS3_00001467 [Schistosoma haematobium]